MKRMRMKQLDEIIKKMKVRALNKYEYTLYVLFNIVLYVFFNCFHIAAQKPIIIDTDIDSDIDDVGALSMLYNLHKSNIIKILGIIVTSDDPYATTCVSALNNYYKMNRIPIGFLEKQSSFNNNSRYTKQISDEFPHPLKSYKDAYPSTELYRKLLSESKDSSVIIITIGHLSSLSKLLSSTSDQYSLLNGLELVNKKVYKWFCMGGIFPNGKEANFSRPDPASTVYCLSHWPKNVIFCGWEIGEKVITGKNILKRKLSPHNPVYRAYELFNDFSGRPSWDQTTIFLLLNTSNQYFFLDNAGRYIVDKNGVNHWIKDEIYHHGIIHTSSQFDYNSVANYITDYMAGLFSGNISLSKFVQY